MPTAKELSDRVVTEPDNIALRLQIADQLSDASDPRGDVIRWQCELESLTEADDGWYWRRYKLANLLLGTNPFMIAFGGTNLESDILSELHSIKHDGKSSGSGKVERGFIESFSVSDIERLKVCEQAIVSAAPLIHRWEFSNLNSTSQFEALQSLGLLPRIKHLIFKKCKFPKQFLDSFFNLPSLQSVESLSFHECEFADGIEGLAATRVSQQLQKLLLMDPNSVAEQRRDQQSYLGKLFSEDAFPKLTSLELDRTCTAFDLLQLQSWKGLRRLESLEMTGINWPANAWCDLLKVDLPALETLILAGTADAPSDPDLSSCSRLKSLTIKGQQLPAASVKRMSQTLPAGLQQLQFVNCQLTSAAVAELLNGQPFPNLRRLNLQVNELDADCATAIANTAWLENLIVLKLSFNHIGDAGALSLAGSAFLKKLVFLDLSETGLTDEGAQAIFNAPTFSSLQWLNLDTNDITSASVPALLDPKNLRQIVALRLKGNAILDEQLEQCTARFGEEAVESYWLGYLI